MLTPRAYSKYHHVEFRPRYGLSAWDSFGGIEGVNLLKDADNPSMVALTRQLERMHPDLEIHVPIRITQAEADERIWMSLTDPLVEQLEARNPGRVTYQKYMKIDAPVSPSRDPERLGYHFGTVETDGPEVVAWVEEQLLAER